MTEINTKAAQLRNVFTKVAGGALQPGNFGDCLMTAANEGFSSKEEIARILGADVSHIRKVGNSLKCRDIANVSVALLAEYERHHG